MSGLEEIRRNQLAIDTAGMLINGKPVPMYQYVAILEYASKRADLLVAAVDSALALHKPRTEQVITGDCSAEECDHEDSDDCPKSPFEACVECWRVAEEADAYFSEGGVLIAAYPCPTVKAIETILAAQP